MTDDTLSASIVDEMRKSVEVLSTQEKISADEATRRLYFSWLSPEDYAEICREFDSVAPPANQGTPS